MTIHQIFNAVDLRTVAPNGGDILRLMTPELDLESVNDVRLAVDNLIVEGGLDVPTVIHVGDDWMQAARHNVFRVEPPSDDGHVVFRHLEFHGGHTARSRPTWGANRKAILVNKGMATIQNCRFVGWPHAAVDVAGSTHGPAQATIESSRFTACRADRLGYGVVVGNAKTLITQCTFSFCRHAIASRNGQPSEYKATNNVVVVTENESSFDVHGSLPHSTVTFEYRLNDEAPDISGPREMDWCGGGGGRRYEIANNTFFLLHPDSTSSHWKVVQIRGEPDELCDIYDNRIVSASGAKGSIGILAGTYHKYRIFNNRREAV